MADNRSAEDRLAALRELIVSARAMPMSSSCVINRAEVLAAIDDVIQHLPEEIAGAQDILDQAAARIAAGEATAEQVLAEARDRAAALAKPSEVLRLAQEQAAAITAEAEAEAQALRRETDAFIDARMASFESVLHKTSSQVATARARLAERSGLNGHALSVRSSPVERESSGGGSAARD